jgi:hypothetical protein
MQPGHVSASKSVSLRYPPRWLMVGAMTFLCFCLWTVGNADDQKKDVAKEPPKDIWARKLEHAQKVLAAVAQDDPQAVVRNAEELIKISNDLAWKRFRTERYEELSKEFRREAEGLINAAKAKNNEAMALGYVKMSISCFNCHNHVRTVNIAGP